MTTIDMQTIDLEPLASRQLKDEAYFTIKDAITSLRLRPGAAIMEGQLARCLGISKTPIRMALVRLENEGFVETRRASGTFVRRMTFEDVREVFEVREAIEQLAARRVAATALPEQLQALRANVDDSRRLVLGGDEVEAFGAVRGFHLLLVDFAGNRWLSQTYRSLFDHIVRIGNVCGRIPGRNERSIGEHLAVVDELAAHDGARAAAEVAAHLASLLEDYGCEARSSPLLQADGHDTVPTIRSGRRREPLDVRA
jgi:DNA-binding GntR family transcriptional regulator